MNANGDVMDQTSSSVHETDAIMAPKIQVSQQSRLLALPKELRCMVWEFVLGNVIAYIRKNFEYICVQYLTSGNAISAVEDLRPVASILFLCKSTYDEVSEVFWEKAIISFKYLSFDGAPPMAVAMLEDRSWKPSGRLRSLELPYTALNSISTMLMKRKSVEEGDLLEFSFPNLRSIQVVHSQNLKVPKYSDIMEIAPLRKICSNFIKITTTCEMTDRFRNEYELGELQQEVLKDNMTITVTCDGHGRFGPLAAIEFSNRES